MRPCILSCLLLLTHWVAAQSSELYVNELVASNSSGLIDEFGNYSDWLELYNSSSEPIDLTGYTLTDDLLLINKWTFSDVIIDAQSYLLIFASGQDASDSLESSQGELHTNFSLSKGGEFLAIYDPLGGLIDSLTFSEQQADISYGRSPNATSVFGFFTEPTPGAANSSFADPIVQAADFSPVGGFHDSPINVSLNAEIGSLIYYTVDGTIPTENSTVYSTPIELTSTSPIRSIVIAVDGRKSLVSTHTYLINETNRLPVVSIVTDPDHFFSDRTGIYVTGTNGIPGNCDEVERNLNQDWERPANIELYEKDGTVGLNQVAGVKIFGGCSRTRFPQKSLSFFARKEYGKGSFDYQLFPDKEIHEFESFLLRSSGDDQVHTMFKDAFTAYAIREFMDLDYMAYRPAVVYINGEYWGIHNLREKVNEHYIESNFDVDKDDVNILEGNALVAHGSNASYNEMINFVSSNDLSEPANYKAMSKLMDIGQFIDYEIANIHLGEIDWPGNNIKFWNAPDTQYDRWRWILFDRDQSFRIDRAEVDALSLALSTSGPSWPNPPWSTLLFRRLLRSDQFTERFAQTYAYHIGTTFDSTRVSNILSEFKSGISGEIPKHIRRWGGQVDPDKSETWPRPTFNSYGEWEANVEEIRTFLALREPFALVYLDEQLSPEKRWRITITSNNADAGIVKMYDKELPVQSEILFFHGLPIDFSAVAKDGFQFSHWEIGDQEIPTDELHFSPSENTTLIAHFEPSNDIEPIVINEINYNSNEKSNSGDWIELYNPNNTTVNISGWKLIDEKDNTFVFINNRTIEGKGYVVVCESLTEFDEIFPLAKNRFGGLGFKLSNNGEVVRLLNTSGHLIDSVRYSDEAPWPILSDGGGSSLELVDHTMDNNLGENWRASITNGSPGGFNHENILVAPKTLLDSNDKSGFVLNQNFPNPIVNGSTTLSYELMKTGSVTIKLFDFQGKEIDTIIDAEQSANKYEVKYRLKDPIDGLYFVIMQFDNTYFQVAKMLVQ